MPRLPKLAHRWILLAAVFFCASVALRLVHVDWGLPEIEEEALPAKKAFEMWGWESGQLELDPQTAGWPSFSFYVHLGWQHLQFAVGRLSGEFEDRYDYYVAYQLDPTKTIVWARVLNILLSSVAVIVALFWARRFGKWSAGVTAAALVALSPLMVGHAQMVEPDALVTLLAALAMLRLGSVLEHGRRRDYAIVALLAGLGAASKYTPVLLCLSLYAVHLLRRRREGLSNRMLGLDDPRIAIAALASLLAFCAASPYTFANLEVLQRDLSYQLMHMSDGHFGQTDRGLSYAHYLTSVLPRAIGWPALVAAFGGLGLAAIRRRDEDLILLAAFVPYFVVLGSLSTQFDRYMLPLILPLAVAAASALEALNSHFWSVSGQTRIAAVVGTVALVALPAGATVRHLGVQGAPSTQRAAAEWLAEFAPDPETTIVTERYGPHLRVDPRSEYATNKVFSQLDDERQARLLEREHRIYQILPMYSVRVQLSAYYYELRHFLAYDFVVISGSVSRRYAAEPERYPRQNAFYSDLEIYMQIAAQFTGGAHARGPKITIYRWKPEGASQIVRDRGMLDANYYREWVNDLHSPHFLAFTEQVGVHSELEKRFDLASVCFETLSKTAPENQRAFWIERAGVASIHGEELDRAEEFFSYLLRGDPAHVVALGNLGLIAERRGDAGTAQSWYQRTIDADHEGTAARWAARRLEMLENGTAHPDRAQSDGETDG